jgi:hypothetical protein
MLGSGGRQIRRAIRAIWELWMVLLYSVPDNFVALAIGWLLGNAVLNGLAGGFLAWLIGAAGRPRRLPLGRQLMIGAAVSVLLLLLLGALVGLRLLSPPGATLPWAVHTPPVVWYAPAIVVCALAALAANARHLRKNR